MSIDDSQLVIMTDVNYDDIEYIEVYHFETDYKLFVACNLVIVDKHVAISNA